MASVSNEQEHDKHSQSVGGDLDEQAVAILERGISSILQMTEGLAFQDLPSEKFPFPLTSVQYKTRPQVETIRARGGCKAFQSSQSPYQSPGSYGAIRVQSARHC